MDCKPTYEDLEKDNERKYRDIISSMADVVYIFSNKRGSIFFSPSVEKILGYTLEYLYANPFTWNKSIHPDDRPVVEKAIMDSGMGKPFEVEYRIMNANGEWCWLNDRSIAEHCADDELLIKGIARDITEQKYAEEALRESEELFRKLAEDIPGYICAFLPDGTLTYINPTLASITGMSPDELVGNKVFDFLDPEEANKIIKKLALLTPDNPVEAHEQIYIDSKGIPQYQEWRNQALFDENGKIYHFLGVGVDITEKKHAEIRQKKVEEKSRRIQKVESLGLMAGGIAHLFNNYLQVMIGNLELALDELPDNSLARESIIDAMDSARRSSDVSKMMLTYLGQTVVENKFIDISEFCRKNLPKFQTLVHSGITIDADIKETDLIVSANEGQMHQILNHLITNACESIGDNTGIITIVTHTMGKSDIVKSHILPVDTSISSDIYGCIEVTDTGCGIETEDIYKLPDPFFTTKFTGRGLGLAVVLGIVKSWAGMVVVKSRIGHGSSFMVLLPLSSGS